MRLPKAKKRKLITKKFVGIARKVRESFEEEAQYLREKRLQHEDYIPSHTPFFSSK